MKCVSADRSGGFTLIEIMIVVLIIGLLAAIAIPAFQKVRVSALEKTVLNDGRRIGNAAQQYMMENGVTQVAISSTNGLVAGPLADHVKHISAKLVLAGSPIEADNSVDAFSLYVPGAFGDITVQFDSEGRKAN